MSRFTKRGSVHIGLDPATETYGARQGLQIIFIHENPNRTVETLLTGIQVLVAFAKAYTAGAPDVKGKTPAKEARPCQVILVCEDMDTSTSDIRTHMSVEAASIETFSTSTLGRMTTRSGIRVYAREDNSFRRTRYDGWHRIGEGPLTSRSGREARASRLEIEEAMANDFGRVEDLEKAKLVEESQETGRKNKEKPAHPEDELDQKVRAHTWYMPPLAQAGPSHGTGLRRLSDGSSYYHKPGADDLRAVPMHSDALIASTEHPMMEGLPRHSFSSQAAPNDIFHSSRFEEMPVGYLPDGSTPYYVNAQDGCYYTGADGGKYHYDP